MIDRFVKHNDFRKGWNNLKLLVCNSDKFFVDRDPYMFLPSNVVIVVLAKYARGLHLVHEEMYARSVLIDHLPEDDHLLR